MKIGNGWQKKLSHGSAALGIIAAVIVAILILNIAVSALCSGRLWYIDLTPQSTYNVYGTQTTQKTAQMYTLMDETVAYLDYIIDQANARRGDGEDAVKVEIIFCAEPDILCGTEMMRYVYYTALNLQKSFPETISVSYRDVWRNPSSVDQYRSTSYANIYQTSVIIAGNSEYRVCSLRSFYTYDSESDMSVPVGYNGQKKFVQQILDVTGAAAPICCLTINHGEPFASLDLADRENWSEYKEFLKVIEGAGYEIRYLNLETEEIPENCRLILTFDPQTDFVSKFNNPEATSSETARLDAFLDQAYSFMVFLDADSPELPNLEEYLEFWGIELMRYSDEDAEGNVLSSGNYQVTDATNRLDSTGETFLAQYASGTGLGNMVISDMVTSASVPKIVFGNTMPIRFGKTYETQYVMANESTGAAAYSYAQSIKNGETRAIFDIFHAGTKENSAEIFAVADGTRLTDGNGNPIGGTGIYNLMTITAESRQEGEGMGYTTVDRTSYVCAVGSTAFASDAVLGTTAYGNTDALLSVLRYIGKDVNPVGLNFVVLYSPTMDLTVTDASGNTASLEASEAFSGLTIVLTTIPAILVLGVGAVVLTKRKVRR